MSTLGKGTGVGAEPRPHPAARVLTVVLGIVLLILAGIAIRDAWFLFKGTDPAEGWIATALEFLATAEVDVLGVVIGVVVALVGLWLMVAALRPRRRTHMRVAANSSVWMRPLDVARKSTAAVRRDFGSDDISSRANRKRLTVAMAHSDGSEELAEEIQNSLRSELAVLEKPPRISVQVDPVEPREVQ